MTELKKEIINLGEAREIYTTLFDFLWNNITTELIREHEKIKGSFIPHHNGVVPLTEISKNNLNLDKLLKEVEESNYSFLLRLGHAFIDNKGVLAKKVGTNIEFGLLYAGQLVYYHKQWKGHLNESYLKPKTNVAFIKKFDERLNPHNSEDYPEEIVYSFNQDDIKSCAKPSCCDNPIGKGRLNIDGQLTIRVNGGLTEQWKPLFLKYLRPVYEPSPYFELSEPNESDCLLIQYPENKSLEKVLIEKYINPKDIGNGIKCYSKVPKYLQRKLGL